MVYKNFLSPIFFCELIMISITIGLSMCRSFYSLNSVLSGNELKGKFSTSDYKIENLIVNLFFRE